MTPLLSHDDSAPIVEPKRTSASAAAPLLPRSASFTHVPSQLNTVIEGRSSDDDEGDDSDEVDIDHAPGPSPRDPGSRAASEVHNDGKIKHTRSPSITISQFSQPADRDVGDTSYGIKSGKKLSRSAKRDSNTRSVTESLATFAKKPWKSPSKSRSPSRATAAGGSIGETLPKSSTDKTQSDRLAPSEQTVTRVHRSDQRAQEHQEVHLNAGKKGRGSLSTIFRASAPDQPARSSTSSFSLPKSFSSDRLSTLGQPVLSVAPLALRTASADTLHSMGVNGRKKDELWSVFRTLESDFQKFSSKNSAMKPNVVRLSLLPFLAHYADHPSNKNITPDNLDRRTNILSKWWMGILDSLQGQNSQMIAATDLPSLLQAMMGIMMRPEWRLPPSPFAPLADRATLPDPSRSTTSLESMSSDFLLESVQHAVRNTFSQNLMAQTAFIVSRMSLRRAQASIVSWSGKALAFAFYFCPGVADLLVSLWGIQGGTIKQVLLEYDVDLFKSTDEKTESVSLGFPQFLQPMAYKSYAATIRRLRKPAPTPLGGEKIEWTNVTWLGRWQGRDSDLFFVFVKQWHDILEDFFPASLELKDKMHAPSVLAVQAHLLSVMESTIQRQSNASPAAAPMPTAALTFEDVLAADDASADAMAMPPTNVTRMMAENRLIILLRDIVSESSPDFERTKHTFVEAYTKLVQAVARRIFMFDYNACSTLCDFLEEAVYIVARYQRGNPNSKDADWSFWLGVCKQMGDSPSTLTEMRLFAFLYGVWNTVVKDAARKECLCIGWLLSEAMFEKFFFHWCPIIRAYYMRLLCWRVARCEKEISYVDERIFETLSDRLDSSWALFLYQYETACAEGRRPPSTAPSSPVPGRQLLIIRNEVRVSPSLFLSFDGLAPPASSPTSMKPGKNSKPAEAAAASPVKSSDSSRTLTPGLDGANKRRWSLFQNVKALTSADGTPSSASQKIENRRDGAQRHERADSPSQPHDQTTKKPQRPKMPSRSSSGGSTKSTNTDSGEHSSFRFSLEWLGSKQGLPGEMRLSRPKLPAPVQARWLEPRGERPPPAARQPDHKIAGEKYVGRALAEWEYVVSECHHFFVRRRLAGAPSDVHVEIPTLGVESFRRA
ncbi:MAG: hypothetical protein M1825_002252 [Sarcosagium campestre]|nr:MAG: hypothetical protein M1825_002252 [Sarcosagium campestre]